MKEIKYTNAPWVIAQINNMVSINSAVEIDLTGQVCADSIGTRIFSGTGANLILSEELRCQKEGRR